MSEIMTIKPRLHFIFPNDSKFGVRNLFAAIVILNTLTIFYYKLQQTPCNEDLELLKPTHFGSICFLICC
jgi:hypothetical protein